MSEVSDRYTRIADGFENRLSNVAGGQWSAATPCTDWDVRGLVVHVVSTHHRVVAGVSDSEPPEVDPSGDLLGQWSEARNTVQSALEDPERASLTVSGMFGEQPFESLVGRLLCADTLFHTWDLARATGQDEKLDDEAVNKAMEFLNPIDDAIRRPGGFSSKIEPATGADDQSKLLNFGGRAV